MFAGQYATEDFLTKDKIFELNGTTRTNFELVLIVGYADALIGREVPVRVMRTVDRNVLVGFPAVAYARIEIAMTCHLDNLRTSRRNGGTLHGKEGSSAYRFNGQEPGTMSFPGHG
jgi:hypothetical protein